MFDQPSVYTELFTGSSQVVRKYILPTALALLFPIIVSYGGTGVNTLIWNGAFDFSVLDDYLFPYSDISIPTAIFITIIYIFFLTKISRALNKPGSLSIAEASSLTIILSGIGVLIGYFLLFVVFVLVKGFHVTEGLSYQEKNLLSNFTSFYILSYVVSTILLSFFYTFTLIQHKSLARKRFFWLYAASAITFLLLLGNFINSFSPHKTSPSCLFLNILYIFIIAGTTYIINGYLAKENNKALENSLVSLWIIILAFWGMNEFLPTPLEEWAALMNIVFLPLGIGLVFNALSITIHQDINQHPFDINFCAHPSNKPKNKFFAALNSIFLLVYNLVIIMPAFIIHSLLLCFFGLKTANRPSKQKRSQLTSRLASRQKK